MYSRASSPIFSSFIRSVNINRYRTVVRHGRWHTFSTTARPTGSAKPQSNIRVSTVFGTLMIVGVGSTAYGLYEFYSAFTMWPKAVRDDLRAGVKAKYQGNFNTSERFLTRALDTALSLPLVDLSPHPHAKLSGISILLGEVLEKINKPDQAYEVYAAALERIQNAMKQDRTGSTDVRVSGPERVRAAALAFKLGDMAQIYSQPDDEEEKWLVYAVEELLRALRDTHTSTRSMSSENVADDGGTGVSGHAPSLFLDELELPAWVSKVDVVAPLERLGAFYHRVGKLEYAIPLYISALSVLLPPNSSHVSPETKCQGSHLMNSLASSLAQASSSPERLTQAESWVKKAIAVINTAKMAERDEAVLSQCDAVLVAALFNMGSLKEMAGSRTDAREWYLASQHQASSIKMREGILEAEQALRRLNRFQSGTSSQGQTKKAS